MIKKDPIIPYPFIKYSVKQFVDGMAYTNGIESVWAILKRGFYGIYHSFSGKHLQICVKSPLL